MDKNKQLTPLRVALYLRVSTEQAEQYGIDLQLSALKGLIKSRGKLENGKPSMVLAGKQYIYKDEGMSGTLAMDDRPAFLQMKEDIEDSIEKPFDIVAVYRIDRFARKLKILLDVIEFFEKHDIQFMSANESIDTSTPFGRAMLGIIGVIAELEIAQRKDETVKSTTPNKKNFFRPYMSANRPIGTKNAAAVRR